MCNHESSSQVLLGSLLTARRLGGKEAGLVLFVSFLHTKEVPGFEAVQCGHARMPFHHAQVLKFYENV